MSRFRVRRGAVVAVLLVLAFAVAVALAVQAYGTARYHRAQADRVLRDYAALAAARVAQRSAQEIYYAVVPPLKALKHAHEMAPHKALPVPKDLHFDTMEHEFSLAPYIRVTFRMDLKTGQLTTSGQALPPAVRRWLIDTLPVHSRTVYDTSWHMGTVLGQPDGDRRYVAYTVLRDSKGVLRTALGFEAKPTALKPLVVQATEKFALLPRPLTGGVQYDSMGSIIITDRYGVEIYRDRKSTRLNSSHLVISYAVFCLKKKKKKKQTLQMIPRRLRRRVRRRPAHPRKCTPCSRPTPARWGPRVPRERHSTSRGCKRLAI